MKTENDNTDKPKREPGLHEMYCPVCGDIAEAEHVHNGVGYVAVEPFHCWKCQWFEGGKMDELYIELTRLKATRDSAPPSDPKQQEPTDCDKCGTPQYWAHEYACVMKENDELKAQLAASDSTLKTKTRLIEKYAFDIIKLEAENAELRKQLSAAQQPTAWISVKDRLPEFSKSILLLWNDVICSGYLEEYGDSYRFTDGHMDDVENVVTHWMPLPLPPTPQP